MWSFIACDTHTSHPADEPPAVCIFYANGKDRRLKTHQNKCWRAKRSDLAACSWQAVQDSKPAIRLTKQHTKWPAIIASGYPSIRSILSLCHQDAGPVRSRVRTAAERPRSAEAVVTETAASELRAPLPCLAQRKNSPQVLVQAGPLIGPTTMSQQLPGLQRASVSDGNAATNRVRSIGPPVGPPSLCR